MSNELTTTNEVNLDNAIAWTTNWRNSQHMLHANSFLLPGDDFRDILLEPKVKQIRLYVCLQVVSEEEVLEKLICVGVDENGKDIIKIPSGRGTDENDTEIYDFSHPCPPLCADLNSILAGGSGD